MVNAGERTTLIISRLWHQAEIYIKKCNINLPNYTGKELQPTLPLIKASLDLTRFHEELEKAAKQGWILSSSDVEGLIGVKPKGEVYCRGGWEFTRAGKIGNQGAWKVNKLEL